MAGAAERLQMTAVDRAVSLVNSVLSNVSSKDTKSSKAKTRAQPLDAAEVRPDLDSVDEMLAAGGGMAAASEEASGSKRRIELSAQANVQRKVDVRFSAAPAFLVSALCRVQICQPPLMAVLDQPAALTTKGYRHKTPTPPS